MQQLRLQQPVLQLRGSRRQHLGGLLLPSLMLTQQRQAHLLRHLLGLSSSSNSRQSSSSRQARPYPHHLWSRMSSLLLLQLMQSLQQSRWPSQTSRPSCKQH